MKQLLIKRPVEMGFPLRLKGQVVDVTKIARGWQLKGKDSHLVVHADWIPQYAEEAVIETIDYSDLMGYP